jgi:hypothetical protein
MFPCSSLFLLQIGVSVETFLGSLEPGQPFLLCVGEPKNNIQRFYVIVDHKAIPCKAQTSLAAFNELFKVHFISSVNYGTPQKFCIALSAFEISPWIISRKDVTFEMWTAGMFFIVLHLFRDQETPYSFAPGHCFNKYY